MFASVGNWTIRPSNPAEAIWILLARGAQPDACDDSGRDVATLVRHHGSSAAAELLLGENIEGPSSVIPSPVKFGGGLTSLQDDMQAVLTVNERGEGLCLPQQAASRQPRVP